MTLDTFNTILILMAILAVIVFISLYFVDAGYGMFIDKKWGPAISNKVAWVLMECPVFFIMLILWLISDRTAEIVPIIILIFFEIHYFRRSFIFPLRLKGNGKMPLAIMLMGIVFNFINGFIQGEWLFYLSPPDMYSLSWLTTPQFIIGTVIFFTGMGINIQSDQIIRSLRKPGDTNHYLPEKGLFRYVTSAHYLGEIIEWIGFAILTWSWAGVIFVVWTCANLIPRSATIYEKYKIMFGKNALKGKKRIIPFIY